MKMKEKLKNELATVTRSAEDKLQGKSGNRTIMKIHGLESLKCTFDGTLTKWRPFTTELKQWCMVYEIKGEQALIILGQGLRGIANIMSSDLETIVKGNGRLVIPNQPPYAGLLLCMPLH